MQAQLLLQCSAAVLLLQVRKMPTPEQRAHPDSNQAGTLLSLLHCHDCLLRALLKDSQLNRIGQVFTHSFKCPP